MPLVFQKHVEVQMYVLGCDSKQALSKQVVILIPGDDYWNLPKFAVERIGDYLAGAACKILMVCVGSGPSIINFDQT